jgi:hypothetical protein
MTTERPPASPPTPEDLERLLALLLDISACTSDPAWVRERSVTELSALITTSLQCIAFFLPRLRDATQVGWLFPGSDEEHELVTAPASAATGHTRVRQPPQRDARTKARRRPKLTTA